MCAGVDNAIHIDIEVVKFITHIGVLWQWLLEICSTTVFNLITAANTSGEVKMQQKAEVLIVVPQKSVPNVLKSLGTALTCIGKRLEPPSRIIFGLANK